MMLDELKTCPFCGGTIQHNVNMTNPNYPHHFFTCHKCAASVSFGIPPCTSIAGSILEERAIAAWNRRAEETWLSNLGSGQNYAAMIKSDSQCKNDKCAWYDAGLKQCAVANISRLYSIQDILEDMGVQVEEMAKVR